MELVEGPSLHALLAREGPLSQRRLVQIARGMALGLQAAHHHGLVHRDLKPGNVLVAPGDFAKLVDFGLARASSMQGVDRTALTLVGTPDYMAPEALDPLAVDSALGSVRARLRAVRDDRRFSAVRRGQRLRHPGGASPDAAAGAGTEPRAGAGAGGADQVPAGEVSGRPAAVGSGGGGGAGRPGRRHRPRLVRSPSDPGARLRVLGLRRASARADPRLFRLRAADGHGGAGASHAVRGGTGGGGRAPGRRPADCAGRLAAGQPRSGAGPPAADQQEPAAAVPVDLRHRRRLGGGAGPVAARAGAGGGGAAGGTAGPAADAPEGLEAFGSGGGGDHRLAGGRLSRLHQVLAGGDGGRRGGAGDERGGDRLGDLHPRHHPPAGAAARFCRPTCSVLCRA